MPIYEYSCNKCGNDFEELVFGNTPPSCPQCGSVDTHKLVSCCARHRSGSAGGGDMDAASASSGGGCAGCSGGHCATCGH